MTSIYLIHHIATSLQADQIVSDVYEGLDQALERHFSDADGKLRVISPPTTFSDLLDAAFNQIRQAADGRTDISLRLLGALAGIGAKVRLATHAESVVGHAEMIATAGRRAAQAEVDATAIDAALDGVYERLNVSPE